MGPPQVHRVIQAPVDRLGVVANPEEALEVGIGRGDGPDVLGPVEPPSRVGIVAVEAHGHGGAAVVGRQRVVVVPAIEPALVPDPMRPGAEQLGELQLPCSVDLPHPDGAAPGEELHGGLGAVGAGDGLVLDEGALLDPAPLGPPGR